jgi:hypothetical protein
MPVYDIILCQFQGKNMNIKKLFLLLLPFGLLAQEIVWSSDSRSEISRSEYDRILKEYVQEHYPSKVKAYNDALLEKERQKKLARQKELRQQRELQRYYDKYTVSINGLMWDDTKNTRTVSRTWHEAESYCKNLKLLGFNNWRLPTLSELESILDKRRFPALRKEFKKIGMSYMEYWTTARKGDHAITVSFRQGWRHNEPLYRSNKVRCVR